MTDHPDMPPQDAPQTNIAAEPAIMVWTWQTKALLVVNIVFLILIGIGLTLVIPALYTGLTQNVAPQAAH